MDPFVQQIAETIPAAEIYDHPEAREILGAAKSTINTDHKAWREHAELAFTRHGRNSVDEVAMWAIEKLLKVQRQMPDTMTDPLIEEMIPPYLGLLDWAQAGFPHFNLSDDFFRALAITDFGDPSDDPLYMPFNSFTMSFPKTFQLNFASRVFFHRVPTPSPLGEPLVWDLHRAILMSSPTAWTQWPIGTTRADLWALGAVAKERRDLKVLGQLQTKLLDVVADKTELEIDVEVAKMKVAQELQKLPNAEARAEALRRLNEKVGKFKESSPISAPKTREDLYATPVTEEQADGLNNLRTLLANVLTYIEAAGPLPAVAREKRDAPLAVERIHKTRPIYDVGRVIKLDANTRQALSMGGAQGWRLIHRYMVRGHWRNQVHGPARSLRRRQWIAPFYKGPDNVVEALSRTYEVDLPEST